MMILSSGTATFILQINGQNKFRASNWCVDQIEHLISFRTISWTELLGIMVKVWSGTGDLVPHRESIGARHGILTSFSDSGEVKFNLIGPHSTLSTTWTQSLPPHNPPTFLFPQIYQLIRLVHFHLHRRPLLSTTKASKLRTPPFGALRCLIIILGPRSTS
jgi:hypothetical protein